jgi:hypothetical protein
MHAPVVTATSRDLRLDLFRGIALWLIFLDHIPSNAVSWVTIRNYGFSDAAEIFIFISGYTAAFVYGRSMSERGFIVSSSSILRRAWQIYVAHIFLFVIYVAEISYVAASFENPLYAEEMSILDFLKQPDQTMIQALLLKFRPVNMDILPLYIVLLLLFPAALWLLLRSPILALSAAVALYVLAWKFGWNLPAYPEGGWFFNPFAWQLLFLFGAWCALGGAKQLGGFLNSRITLAVALIYIAFSAFIALSWYLPGMSGYVPSWLEEVIYPIDKTNLDVLRFAHFLALATVTVRFIPPTWPALQSWILQPAIVCGQHSLEVFCLGVFLAFAGHFALVEISGALWMQVVISAAGILLMVATAALLSWYKGIEGRRTPTRQKQSSEDTAEGKT